MRALFTLVLLVATAMIATNITNNSNAMTDENPLLAKWEGVRRCPAV